MAALANAELPEHARATQSQEESASVQQQKIDAAVVMPQAKGMLSLMRSVALEFSDNETRVNAACRSAAKTLMTRHLLESPATLKGYTHRVTEGPSPTPEEQSAAFVLLARFIRHGPESRG